MSPRALEQKQRLKNMFVCTHKAKPSMGESTDMHSKPGYFTINNYAAFIDVHRKVPGIKVSRDQQKHNQILEFLSFVPEKIDETIKRAGIEFDAQVVVQKTQQKVKEALRQSIDRESSVRTSKVSALSKVEEE